jgi:hypothetical protein
MWINSSESIHGTRRKRWEGHRTSTIAQAQGMNRTNVKAVICVRRMEEIEGARCVREKAVGSNMRNKHSYKLTNFIYNKWLSQINRL